MNDKELLELAAKAAGYQIKGDADTCLFISDDAGRSWHEWNPLLYDDNALRLAVKLGISILFGANYVIAGYEQIPTVNNSNDPYAATRRAIVRAAAEIGKGMK